MLQALALTPFHNQHLQHAKNSGNSDGNKGKELTGNKQQQDCNEAINRKMALRHAIILWGRALCVCECVCGQGDGQKTPQVI